MHTVEYYSAKEGNQIVVHARTWMNLENILLNERCQVQRHILYNFIYMKHSEQANPQQLKAGQKTWAEKVWD